MSFWSTLKSMCRTPSQPETRYTISLTWLGDSGGFDCPIYLPEHVAHMLASGQTQLRGEIWRHSGPLYDITLGNTDRSVVCHLSSFPRRQSPVPGGFLKPKPRSYLKQPGAQSTSDASSSSGSTPARGRGTY
jgi:hypothetical protein